MAFLYKTKTTKIYFSVKKESHTGLEWGEGKYMIPEVHFLADLTL